MDEIETVIDSKLQRQKSTGKERNELTTLVTDPVRQWYSRKPTLRHSWAIEIDEHTRKLRKSELSAKRVRFLK